ncbi:MAG: hypothetical protein BroJett040_24050 [Oligoflexia bacterium]|nr:MAG: hypothetical protein BroJett040_24050 [Oligoflexia bacterium]
MKFFLSLGLVLVFSANSHASAAQKMNPIVLGVIDQKSRADYESKLLPILQKHLEACSYCEVRNLTPYNEAGDYNQAALPAQIEQASTSVQILFVNWNAKLNTESKALLPLFNQLSEKGVVLVVAAGAPKEGENSAPLHRTLFGQLPHAMIIGELGEHDRLWGTSYYGPEMLTALRPPKDLIGQGYSPMIFATRLAMNMNKKSGTEWVDYIKTKKQKTKKIWLDLNDIFGR